VRNTFFKSWQGNFWAGLAALLPIFISLALLAWAFGTIANFTDALLFFLPRSLTHGQAGAGPMHWYWSLAALALAALLVCLVGMIARNYFGRKIIAWMDAALMQVPLLNKIYGVTKQVNDAFSTGSKTSFRTVVLVQFPRPGMYSIGFITSEQHAEVQQKTRENVVCVFVPTTPNPTTGFLVLVPEREVTRLEMSVAEGIKYIISLGSVSPDYPAKPPESLGSIPPPAS
jgi:uncharacterized membrane protein